MLVQIVREKKMQMEECIILEQEQGATLLSRLVAGMIKGEVTEEEVVDNVVLVFAAHDTTCFAIAMTFTMLALHPDCHSLLLEEHAEIMRSKTTGDQNLTLDDTKKMKYTWQVARESMRLFPPIFGSFRKAIADIEYEGFNIPKGWKVLWTTYGTHYNSEYFEDPSSFNPSRFDRAVPPYAFLAFGGGPRLCVGYQLAKLNILIFIHFIVTRYDWSLLYPDEPISMDSSISVIWNANKNDSQVDMKFITVVYIAERAKGACPRHPSVTYHQELQEFSSRCDKVILSNLTGSKDGL